MGFAAFFEEDVDVVEVLGEEDEDDEPLGVAVVPEGLVFVGVELEVAVVETAGPWLPVAVEFKQAVLVPAITLTAAVWASNPVLSVRVKPMLVPAPSLTADQVNVVPFCCPKLKRGAALGVAPAWTVRK
jgi:hypothetical protein